MNIKKRIIQLLLVLAVFLCCLGAVGVNAAEDEPYVTAEGSKLIIHTNGQTICGIKYMFTENEFTYKKWSGFVSTGKQNTAVNTTAGYRTLKTYSDGSTLNVDLAGWYNFILTYADKTKECFCAAQVSSLSSPPSIKTDDEFPSLLYVDEGDFTVSGVKYAYLGPDPISCESWNTFVNLGKKYMLQNGPDGYKTLKSGLHDNTRFEVYHTGYYAFVITYNGGERYLEVGVDISVTAPVIDVSNSGLFSIINGVPCTVKWMRTDTRYTYSTWSKYVAAGKADTAVNTAEGYRTAGNISSSDSFGYSEGAGWYNFIVTYNGGKSEDFYSIYEYSIPIAPSLEDSSRNLSDLVVRANDYSGLITSVKIAWVGSETIANPTLTKLASIGKQYPYYNTSAGYRTITPGSYTDTIPIVSYKKGNYVALISTTAGDFWDTINTNQYCSTPMCSTTGTKITVTDAIIRATRAGTSDPSSDIGSLTAGVTSVKYVYAGALDDPAAEAFQYTTWSKLVKKGKENTAANTSAGYRSVTASNGIAVFNVDRTGYYWVLVYCENMNMEFPIRLEIENFATYPWIAAAQDGDFTVNAGDFTVSSVKYVYTGDSEYPCTSWAQMYAKGLENTYVNTSKGYFSIKKASIPGTHSVPAQGWYTFLITTEAGEYFDTRLLGSNVMIEPFVSAAGSKLTLHDGSSDVVGAKYMYTSTPYTYTNWSAFVKEGKKDTSVNTANGYRVVDNAANSVTFEVEELGYYNFVLTSANGRESFYSVQVTTLSEKPSVRAATGGFTFDDGDFTLKSVKYIYTGDSPFSATPSQWSLIKAEGLKDPLHNTTNGYRTIKDPITLITYPVDVSGYYTFLITYDMGEVVCTGQFTSGILIPSVTASGPAIELHTGDCTLNSCKYIWTEEEYAYENWNRFVAKGKLNTDVNTSEGYRLVKNCTDGQKIVVSRNGYYTFILSYTTPDGRAAEETGAVYVASGADKPTVSADPDDSFVTVHPEGVVLTGIKYVYTGDAKVTYTNLNSLIATGKQHTAENTTNGYRSLSANINNVDGTVIGLDYKGWYTFVLTYTDGEIARYVQITEAQEKYNKPYAEIEDMNVTIYANGSDLKEIMYMYTYEPYTYTNWNNFIAKGKQNTYINSTTGYRSIEATGDTSFTCFELGYYTFVMKYRDKYGNNRERYTTLSPRDIRVNINLQSLGGYIMSAEWSLNEENPTLYTKRATGTVSLPTPSAPNNSETIQFGGWYTDLAYTNKVTMLNLTNESTDMTLYAKWILTAETYQGSDMYYTVGKDQRPTGINKDSNFTDVGGWNGSKKINMVANYWGFHDYYQYPGNVITTNEDYGVSKTQGTIITNIPYTVGNPVFGEVTNGIYVAKICNLVGSYAVVNYYFYNSNATDITNFSYGCAADVNCNGDPSALITENSDANGKYLLMQSNSKDTAFRIYLNEADYWIGMYKGGSNKMYFDNVFNTSSGNISNSHWDKNYRSGQDSSMTYNWRNFNIPAGQYVVKSIRFGVGSVTSMGSRLGTVVNLDANGGTFEDGTNKRTISDSSTTKLLVGSFEEPTRAGYTFAGWNSSNVGAGKSYVSTDYVSNTEIYALWTKNISASSYKLYNHSYVTAGADAHKLGSAVAKITLNYPGGLIQQGTTALGAVSADNDFVATISITDGYYLPNNISVKVGNSWLAEGTAFIYEINETKTAGTLVIHSPYLTGNAHVYIYGTDSVVIKPVVSVSDKTIYVGELDNVSAVVDAQSGYTYSYQWYLCPDMLGSSKKALSSAAAKTADLAFTSNSTGTWFYQCRVTAKRNADGQSAQTLSDVVAVYVRKKPLNASVVVNSDGSVGVSSNPDNMPVIYSFYTDEDLINKTSYENGATEVGGRPIKPLADGGNYYVQALIPEGKKTLSCQTEAAVYDKLPDLPYLTTEGYFATLHDNNTNVKAVKFMYSPTSFSYTTWAKYTAQGKKNTKINSANGYRNISQQKDSQGDPISMDGTVIEMSYEGCYTFLITMGNGTEVAYSLLVSSSDLAYHKPLISQPTTDGRVVVFYDNESGLTNIKYMYSPSTYKYSNWSNYVSTGKQNMIVNTKSGYHSVSGTVSEGVSSLDRLTITLSNEGYYTFILGYGSGKEKYETIRVANDHETNDNIAVLLVNNGVITATTANGDEILYIKFVSSADYQSGNTLRVNATGLYNIAVIDEKGYTYYLVADITTLDNSDEPTVDKSALLARLNAADTLYDTYRDLSSPDGADPGKYVLTSAKSAFATEIANARAVYNDPDATQTDVDMAYRELGNAINTYNAAVFTVEPELVTTDGSTINVEATADNFTLKVLRYNVDGTGQIVSAVSDNWTAFNSTRNKSITRFADGRSYQFTDVPNGIYTFIIQQVETNRTAEYFDYGIVHVDSTEVAVAADTLEARVTAGRDLLENYPKSSLASNGQECIPDSKWNALNSKLTEAQNMVTRAASDPERYDAKDDIIPEIISLNKTINQALAGVAEKSTAEPVVYDPMVVTVNQDNSVTMTRENLSYAFVSYGHHNSWTKVKNAGYKKVTAALDNETGMYKAVYNSAMYNGEYTILAHYADGSEEFRYVNINNIEYPFTVTNMDGKIVLAVNTAPSKVGYCYGSNVKDLTNEFYLFTANGVTEYVWDPMGNGIHTVYVKIGDAGYFVDIEVDDLTLPTIVSNNKGGTGIFTHGLDVTGIDMTSTAFSGKRSPATNTWLDLAAGAYTFKFYIGGEVYTVETVIE